jgi:hypothetical protein
MTKEVYGAPRKAIAWILFPRSHENVTAPPARFRHGDCPIA